MALGKAGDIINILPILYYEYQQTGQRVRLVISREYLGVVDRVFRYVDPVVWEGKWTDLREAIKWAKRQLSNLVVTQTHGDNFPIQKRTHSFALDAWDRAGMVDKWDTLPLPLERRPVKGIPKEPFILVADQGESAPFDTALLDEAISNANLDGHRIVKASEFKADCITDMVSVYDAASAVVTIDTAHLHLTLASATPVLALSRDRPSSWHGSPWSKRFVFYSPYSEFKRRVPEFVQALRECVPGGEKAVEVSDVPGARKYAYNPSVLDWGGHRLVSWRYHPEPDSWRTQVEIDGLPLNVSGYGAFSIEDGRLFMFRGKPHVSVTIGRSPTRGQKFCPCVVAYGEILNRDDHWYLDPIFIKHGKNDWSGTEKNWSFWEHEDQLYCTYMLSPEHIVLQVEGNKVVKVHKTRSPECSYGSPRGGTCPIPFGDGVIRFFHASLRQRSDYSIGALIMDPKPPFQVRRFSKPLVRSHHEYISGHRYWKPRIAIPYGAVEEGDRFLVYHGVNDSWCRTASIPKERLV
jgi:hypothetical protein